MTTNVTEDDLLFPAQGTHRGERFSRGGGRLGRRLDLGGKTL